MSYNPDTYDSWKTNYEEEDTYDYELFEEETIKTLDDEGVSWELIEHFIPKWYNNDKTIDRDDVADTLFEKFIGYDEYNATYVLLDTREGSVWGAYLLFIENCIKELNEE